MLGSQEAIRQGQQKERREEHRARRCHLVVGCLTLSRRGRAIDGRQIVLKDNRLWIDTGNHVTEGHHPFTGYYLPFPDCKYEGVVSTITSVAPILNWIYIDKATSQVKYGVRVDAEPNLTGPFDCTRQDRRLTFEGWEGFCAVEEEPDLWALYFDHDDNGLEGKKPPHARALEITLSRKEMKITREELRRQQELQSNIKIVNRANQQSDAPAPPGDSKAQQERVDENLKAPQASAGAAIPESIPEETQPVLVSSSSDNANHVPSSPTEVWGSGSIWSQQTESRAEPTLPFTPASSVYADDRVSENEGRAPEQETPRAGKAYKLPYVEDADDGKAEDTTSGFSAPAIDLEEKVEEHADTHELVPPPLPTQETVDEPKPTINLEKSEEHTSNDETPPTQETDESKSASGTLQERPTNTPEAEIEGHQITPLEQVEAAHPEQHVLANESPASAPAEHEKLAGSAEPTMDEEPSRDVPMASGEATGTDEKEMSPVEPLTPTLQTGQGDSSSVSEKPLSPPRPAAAPTTAGPAAAALGPSPSDGQQDAAATTDDMLAYLRLLRLQDAPNPSPWTTSEGPHRPLPSPDAPLHLHQQQDQQDPRVPPEYAVDYDEWSQTAPTHLLSPSPTASPTGSKAPTTRSVSLASTAPAHSSGRSATASRSSSLTISAPARTRSAQEDANENEGSATSASAGVETKTSVPNPAVANTRPLPPPPPSPPPPQTSSSLSSAPPPSLAPPPPQPFSLPDPVAWDQHTTTLDFLSQPYSLAQDLQQSVTDPAPTQRNDTAALASASPAAVKEEAEVEGEGEGAADGEAKGKKRWGALRTRMKSLREKSSRKMR